VPSTWERGGHGTPLYVHITYPFKVDPPRVMGGPDKSFTSFKERNPAGSCLRGFEVPTEWKVMPEGERASMPPDARRKA